MPGNPLAAPEQEALELAAVALLQDPEVRAEVAAIAAEWLARAQPDACSRALFDAEFEQMAFCAALNVLNDDPLRPCFHAFARFAHAVGGTAVPGTRVAQSNADYVYRFAPVDGASRYVVRGHAAVRGPTAFEFSLLNARQEYLGNLSADQLAIGADGRFTITLDPDPAGERQNHLQTRADAVQVLVRDVLGDVAVEDPHGLWIERLGPAPAPHPSRAPPAARHAAALRKLIDDMESVMARQTAKPANRFDAPVIRTDGVFHVAQAYASGHFDLADDEALVFTLRLGGAAYAVVPVNNRWGGIGAYPGSLGSLGTGRAHADADGSYTVVLSPRDPGTPNWVDTGGLHRGVVIVRWAGIPPNRTAAFRPELDVRHCRLDALEELLPAGTPRLTPAERVAQRERHRHDYGRLFG